MAEEEELAEFFVKHGDHVLVGDYLPLRDSFVPSGSEQQSSPRASSRPAEQTPERISSTG